MQTAPDQRTRLLILLAFAMFFAVGKSGASRNQGRHRAQPLPSPAPCR